MKANHSNTFVVLAYQSAAALGTIYGRDRMVGFVRRVDKIAYGLVVPLSFVLRKV